jgi:transposase
MLPHLARARIDEVTAGRNLLLITARTCARVAVACPDCARLSQHEHSRYTRHLSHVALGGRAVRIDLSVRRLYCDNTGCPPVTFVEQVDGLTVGYQRRTPLLQHLLEAVAVALGGKAGARLALVLPAMVSWATLLRILMSLADPPAATPRVLGVDDFALRKGHRYATLLVDCRTRLPIEVWAGREAAPLAHWLATHPGVEIVCRDGSDAYRAGISAGAPAAVQVSARFHLWAHLIRQVTKTGAAHRLCLRAEAAGPQQGTAEHEDTAACDPTGALNAPVPPIPPSTTCSIRAWASGPQPGGCTWDGTPCSATPAPGAGRTWSKAGPGVPGCWIPTAPPCCGAGRGGTPP